MRVLVIASRCDPGGRGEAGAAWAWCRAAARDNEVRLITRSESQAAIAHEVAERPVPGLGVVAVDLAWGRDLWGSEVLWQRLADRTAQRLHDEHGSEVIHHLTARPGWIPRGAVRRTGARLVWGPIGCPRAVPLALARWLGPRGVVAELLRRLWTIVACRLIGRQVAGRVDVVVAQDNDTVELLGRNGDRGRIVVQPAVAVRPVSTGGGPTDGFAAFGTRTALFAGRLVPARGLLLAISALARPAAAHWELRVLGDGPDWRRAERLAERLGVRDRIEFGGDVPRQQILSALLRADAFLAPWLHAPGWTVGESLARGCPVVCLDLGAAPALVGPGEGAVVPWRGDVVGGLAEALGGLTGRIEPVARWSPDRLPDVLAGWYSAEPARH